MAQIICYASLSNPLNSLKWLSLHARERQQEHSTCLRSEGCFSLVTQLHRSVGKWLTACGVTQVDGIVVETRGSLSAKRCLCPLAEPPHAPDHSVHLFERLL